LREKEPCVAEELVDRAVEMATDSESILKRVESVLPAGDSG